MTTKTIISRIKRDRRVEDAREDIDGCWIFLKSEYPSDEDPLQPSWTIHEDTWAEATKKLP